MSVLAVRRLVNRAAASARLQKVRVQLAAFRLMYRAHLALEATSTKAGINLLHGAIRLSRVRRGLRSERLRDLALDLDIKITDLAARLFKLAETIEHRRLALPYPLHRVDRVADLRSGGAR